MAQKSLRNVADNKGSPFHELGLSEVTAGMGRTRVRQHVNPLRAEFRDLTGPLDWASCFTDATLPLVVDLGCGPGRFLLLLARRHAQQQQQQQQHAPKQQHAAQQQQVQVPLRHQQQQQQRQSMLMQPPYNYLGVEIREPLVQRATQWASQLGLSGSVHFVYANATLSLESMLASYPGGVQAVLAQFPDPHFKKRHHKRRIIQPQLARAVAALLRPGGHLFLQSDVEEAVAAMRDAFEQHAGGAFELAPEHSTQPTFFSQPQAGPAGTAAVPQPGAAPAAGSNSSKNVSGSSAAQRECTTSSSGGGSSSGSRSSRGRSTCGSGVPGSPGVEAGPASDGSDDGDDAGSAEDEFQSEWARGGWLVHNPVGVPTEREHYVLDNGGEVYRLLLVRVAAAAEEAHSGEGAGDTAAVADQEPQQR